MRLCLVCRKTTLYSANTPTKLKTLLLDGEFACHYYLIHFNCAQVLMSDARSDLDN